MKKSTLILILYSFLGVLFVIGTIFQVSYLVLISNFLLIPLLLLYFRYRTKRLFKPVAAALILFYIKDIFLSFGFFENTIIIRASFFLAFSILLMCSITGFQKAKVHPVEFLSFLIMYSFLTFLFISLSDVVPEVVPSYQISTYIYLLLLMVFMGISFTAYLLKAHKASLWLMVTGACLLVSEISLFFKLFIIEDFSVNLFFPIFRVIAYFALVEFGLHRRKSQKLLYF